MTVDGHQLNVVLLHCLDPLIPIMLFLFSSRVYASLATSVTCKYMYLHLGGLLLCLHLTHFVLRLMSQDYWTRVRLRPAVYTKRGSECTMQSIAVFTTCESSVDPCPTAGHSFVTCASMTWDYMVPCLRGPCVNTRALISPTSVPGQCVHVNAA